MSTLSKEEVIYKYISNMSDSFDAFYKNDVLNAMDEYGKLQSIAFAEWYHKLTPTQRCTVHPPAASGSGTGLFEQDTSNLYEKYLLLQSKQK